MTSTTTDAPPVAGLPEDKRREIVSRLLDDVMAARIDKGTGHLLLDCLGLAGDRDVIAHALAARHLRDGLRDGSIDPYAVNPEIVVGREQAIEFLAEGYDREYDDSVATLAEVRELPGQVA